MKKISLKNENRGASLLAVLIVLVVISAIAVVITSVTITNIQMKEVERGTKKNFYSAESVMDALRAGAGEKSAEAMKYAYQSVMENYVVSTASGKNLQEEFSRVYLEKLEETFNPADGAGTPYAKETSTDGTSGDVTYSISYYNKKPIEECIDASSEISGCSILYDKNTAKYEADYKAGTFILKNLSIEYTDEQKYKTTICTDLVFNTPQMNFNNEINEFMKYALIADKQINVNASSITVNGNAYAGDEGILADNKGSGAFNGKVTITRGDIVTDSGTSLAMGTKSSSVWAQNVETERYARGSEISSIVLNGNTYIEDDLTLNGEGSTVTVNGNYYGYNFQQNYDSYAATKNAEFNSAMMINARNCKLDLSGINYLMLSGRTFVARGRDGQNGSTVTKDNDVMLGESLSVRTNQLAYYVPAGYVNAYDPNNIKFSGIQEFETDTGISNIASYLNASNPIVAYYYGDNVNYYLNFASEQKANDYFAEYANNSSKKSDLRDYAGEYLTNDAIILDKNHIFALKGDIMYRDKANAKLQVEKVTIQDDSWNIEKDASVYADYSAKLAMKYKALQLSLKEAMPGITTANVRITSADGKIDKTADALFDNLINKEEMSNEVDSKGTDNCYTISSSLAGKTGVALIKNSDDTDPHNTAKNYVFSTSNVSFEQGIIVATGDVLVTRNFRGLIICGGKITFNDNVTVTSDKALVANLFKEDAKRDGGPAFSQFFKEFSADSITDHISGDMNIDSYLGYENWKKY